MRKVITRLLADLALAVAAVWFPAWLTFLAGLPFLFSFNPFYEFIAIGFLADLLYGVRGEGFFGLPVFYAGAATALVVAANAVKKRLRL